MPRKMWFDLVSVMWRENSFFVLTVLRSVSWQKWNLLKKDFAATRDVDGSSEATEPEGRTQSRPRQKPEKNHITFLFAFGSPY